MGWRQIGQSELVEGEGEETVKIGRFVRLEIVGSGFAGVSRGGGELDCEVRGVKVGCEEEALEFEDEKATVFVGGNSCVPDKLSFTFDKCEG